ncbi:MAG: NAD-dependent epimerase/dehydratase family protein [Anaerolineae bacterium]|nr:NAD-dependent epimerase/dehydratase family protein [Anaerolineae bacterium]
MKYFLTGATGFVGGHVARQLIEAGHQVLASVRSPEKASQLAALGVQLHKGDVTDKESMRAPMSGVDGVFHIAGWYKVGVRDKSEAYKINVEGTRNVLALMQELKIPKGVYTSTLAVNSDTAGKQVDENYRFNGQHLSVYDQTKAEAHLVAEEFIRQGLPLVIVQPGLIYGPGDTSSVRTTLIQFLKRQLPLMPEQTAFSWAHVDDIARGHIQAMEKGQPGQSYLLCGPAHTFIEAMQIASETSGVPLPGLRAKPGMLKTMSALMAVVEKVIPLPESYTGEGLRIVAGVTYLGDNSKAKRELDFDPRPLREAWVETVQHEMRLL